MMMKQYPLTAAQKMHDDWIKKYKTQQVSGVSVVASLKAELQPAPSGLSAGAGADELSAAGTEPD